MHLPQGVVSELLLTNTPPPPPHHHHHHYHYHYHHHHTTIADASPTFIIKVRIQRHVHSKPCLVERDQSLMQSPVMFEGHICHDEGTSTHDLHWHFYIALSAESSGKGCLNLLQRI
jgi:hypothetical protein